MTVMLIATHTKLVLDATRKVSHHEQHQLLVNTYYYTLCVKGASCTISDVAKQLAIAVI